MGKILSIDEAISYVKQMKKKKKKVVFTNGCFDIVHRGHIEYLQKAKELGDILIVGLNSDESVKRLKGKNRPIMPQEDRAYILSHIVGVDVVCIFEEDTPQKLIESLVPDILVKGAEYKINEIVGRETVFNSGGKVLTIPMVKGKSTRNLIRKIANLYK